MTVRGWLFCLAVTLTFDSSPIKGEGDSVGWVVLLLYARPLTSGLRIKSAMTVRCAGLGRCVASFCGYCLEASTSLCATVVASSYSAWRVYPTLWFPAYAGMTVRDAWNDGTGWIGRCRVSFSPFAPVSGTGTGFGPLPSRERGIDGCVGLLSARAVDTALKPV